MERKGILDSPVFWGAIGLYGVAFGTGTTIAYTLHKGDTKERIAAVQEHNSQIEQSLERDFPGMGRLILNDETNTFEFHAKDEQTDLSCTGEYSIGEDNKAKASGDIVCSETIVLGGN